MNGQPGAGPAPGAGDLAAGFYGWLRRGELRVQACDTCHWLRHIPRVLCPRCAGDSWHWHRCAGGGRLYSWTTTYRALHPSFSATPFTVGIIELDEGPRLIASLVDCDEADLRAGLPVRLMPGDAGTVVPVFAVRGEAGPTPANAPCPDCAQ